jgi:hypothetical protein
MHGIVFQLDPVVRAIAPVHFEREDHRHAVPPRPRRESVDGRNQGAAAGRLLHGALLDEVALHVDDEQRRVMRPNLPGGERTDERVSQHSWGTTLRKLAEASLRGGFAPSAFSSPRHARLDALPTAGVE